MPPNLHFPGSAVWEVLFRSTDSRGLPIAANTTYLLPPNHQPNGPLMSYQHIINSLGHKCKIATDLYTTDPFTQIREAPGLNIALARGWAIALPDHLGPRMAYGAAKLGGQITSDGIRAVKNVPELEVTNSPVGIGGYSGGGMATAWAAAIGLEREYPERIHLGEQLNPQGRWLRSLISNGCTNEIMLWGVGRNAAQMTDNPNFMDDPEAWSVLRENSLEYYPGIPDAPTFEWHSPTDVLMPVDAIDRTTARYCAAGAYVKTTLTPSPDHLSAAALGLIPALNWMETRFRGEPVPATC